MSEKKPRIIKGEERERLLAKYRRLNDYLGDLALRDLPRPQELVKKCQDLYAALYHDGMPRGMVSG